jgi:hypothetical protein
MPSLLMAQVGEYRNDLAVGGNVGYVMSNVGFVPDVPQGFLKGMTAGLSVRYTCEKYFAAICAITAEVNYAKMGWKELIETSEDTYSRDMSYVQVPIFARLGWGRERRGGQFFIQAGPQLGYCFSDKEHRGGEWSDGTLYLRPNHVTQQYGLKIDNRFEYGIAGGGGFEFSGKFGHILLDARYFFALSDIFKNGKKDPFGRSANGPIIVKMTYLFDLKKTKGDHIK